MASIPLRMLRALVGTLTRYFGGSSDIVLTEPIRAGQRDARLYLRPDADHASPILIYFHGGGFFSCDLDTHDALCRRLVAISGIRIVSVDYRLAPEHPAPAQFEDALDACRWALLKANGPILVGGDSAGGYLAVRCAAMVNAEKGPAVAGLLLLYPLLRMEAREWRGRWVGGLAMRYIRSQWGVAGYPSIGADDIRWLPKTLIATGHRLDPVHADAIWLAEAMEAEGIPVVRSSYPRLFHGALNMAAASLTARQVLAEAGMFLRGFMKVDRPG